MTFLIQSFFRLFIQTLH